ncbi:tetratricopeptide repeat protein [Thermococcus sp. MAR1]|nr:tetratricopeptide repeat protein [Thermococcus sp. MAR1]
MNASSLIKLLSNETNLEILSVLRSGSFNPRELARILGRDETDVSRRLRAMERAGLVEGRWVRIRGKNVKVYSLKVDGIEIRFEPGEVLISTSKGDRYEVPLLESRHPLVDIFVGREKEIDLITSSEKSVIVIYGIAGIGKTALAAKLFSDAFWYQMSEGDSLDYFAWQVGLFLNSLGYDALLEYLRAGGREERDIFELLLDGVEKSSAKIVIDDLHKCRDERILHLLAFLSEKLDKGKLVVTSREKPNLGLNALYIRLSGLSLKEAYSLIKAKGINVSSEEFAEIYQVTFGHPLALTLFSEAYDVGKEFKRESFFDFILSEVYEKLRENERLLLQIMSLFDEPLEYDEIRALYDKRNVFSVLHSLLNKGLIERRGNLYFVHDLIRGFLSEVREVDEAKLYSKYIGFLLEKNNARDFLKAFKYAVKLKDDEIIKRLVELRLRKFKRIIQDFPDAYLNVLSTIKDNPYVKEELANIYFQKGFFEKALRLWLEIKDELEGIHKADVLSSLVDVYTELNKLDESKKYLKELEKMKESMNDAEVDFWYFVELTKLNFYLGKPEEALKSAFNELKVVRKLGAFPEFESLVLLHMGDIHVELERYRESLKYYSQALELARAYSLSFMEHLTLFELSKAYYLLGDYKKAVEHAAGAGDYFLRVRNYRRAVDALAYRCFSYIALGELERAQNDAREMIRIAQSTGYPLGWAGYIALAAVENLRGGNFKEYLNIGREKLKEYPRLYGAVLKELERVFEVSKILPQEG